MRADAYRLPAQRVCEIVHELIDQPVITPIATASAVYCRVASQATRDRYGASRASNLIRTHADSFDGRALIPALRALVGTDAAEPADLDHLAATLLDAGRRPELATSLVARS